MICASPTPPHRARASKPLLRRTVRLTGLPAIVACACTSAALAQPTERIVGPDGFLSLPQKISVRELEGLKAIAFDATAGPAYQVDVRDSTLIVRHQGTEVARGVLAQSGTARETCFGFEHDDGRLKEGYALCRPAVDMTVTARPQAKDGYFAPLKAGALYLKVTVVDRNYGTREMVYSAALLKPRL
jgi:hypothetical protein